MLERFVIDLGEARDNVVYNIKYWRYLYVGDCDGTVSLRFNTPRGPDLDPEEFDKITDLKGVEYLYITNIAQSGKQLVLYYEERRGWRWI